MSTGMPDSAGSLSDSADSLRETLAGLVSFAAAEETMLLTRAPCREASGDADLWAARPTIAHNSEFRCEQVQRLIAIRWGSEPPDFPRVDHAAPDAYRRYAEVDEKRVWELSRTTTAALIDETRRCSDADLLDPARNPWLRGRQLWLQIVVRGFWHPTGHVGDYYARHGHPERALALHSHALATARYLGAPPMAVGMAHYSLACVQALIGRADDAVASLALAVECNPDLREHARQAEDLRPLRDTGRLAAVLA
jgi:hypothetical protein